MAGHAFHRFDRTPNGFVARLTAVVDACDFQLPDLTRWDVAFSLRRQVRIAGLAVQAGDGIKGLLCRVLTVGSCDLYTRPLAAHEMVLCVDEKTSLQPRTRKSPTQPAQPGQPVRVEHEYERKGALNLFAAFDTRTGTVYGMTAERKRQAEFIACLEMLDREIDPRVTAIHLVLDNLRMHQDKQVQAWLAQHPRFVFHHPPVHCSWMNQVEQWFSILQRKRLCIADFADKAALAKRLQAFIREWNEVAHPVAWSTKSVAKIMAKCEPAPPVSAAPLAQAA